MPTLYGMAQPCLSGWSYRQQVTLHNPGTAVSALPVALDMDTRSLIQAGKLRFDGADLRILDEAGHSLPYWIDPSSFDSNSSRIWVHLSSLPSGDTPVYLFYGRSVAEAASDGAATFSFYEDFTSGSIASSTWSVCSDGSMEIKDGLLTLTTGGGQEAHAILTSQQALGSDYIIEMDVTAVSTTGGAFLGAFHDTSQGYALYYLGGAVQTMRLRKLTTTASCFEWENTNPVHQEDALQTEGIWGFGWSANRQELVWPGAVTTPIVRNDGSYSPSTLHHIALGSDMPNSRLVIDWVRARKQTGSTIGVVWGQEVPIQMNVDITTNSPLCEGGALYFNVSSYDGASYSWSGPDGFSSTAQNPSILQARASQSGVYEVVVSGSGACNNVTATTSVTVSAHSEAGSLFGSEYVCAGSNSGRVALSAYTGAVQYWESSISGASPWNTVSVTDDALDYQDLTQTTYFRAHVQNGVCEAVASDAVAIAVSPASEGGYLVGATAVCAGENESEVTLKGYTGDVVTWQYSSDHFSSFQTVLSTDAYLSLSDLDTTHQVRAIVQSGVCPNDTSLVTEITVHPLPAPAFSTTTTCFGEATPFTNATTLSKGFMTSYTWKFGDGRQSADPHPEHLYAASGTYTARLLAISDKGCIDSVQHPVRVKALPEPVFTYDDVCEDIAVTFGNRSTINGGVITSYTWDFGDGHTDTGISPTHTYGAAGDYPVQLTLTSDEQCTDSLIQTIQVFARSEVDFYADSVCDGTPVTFVNNSTATAGHLSYTWDFGDGATSQALNPVHAYAQPGQYLVQLTANATSSCIDQLQKVIHVYPQPIADFSVADVCLQDAADFQNLSFVSSGSLSYSWDFGDGGYSTQFAPDHVYGSANQYEVILAVRSDKGCTADASTIVRVNPQPDVRFLVDPVCVEASSEFQNLSSIASGDLQYTWDFGDGNFATEQEPSHVYATEGRYEVRLEVQSSYGCNDTLHKQAVVWPRPEPDFEVSAVCDGMPSVFANTTVISSGELANYQWDFGDGSTSTVAHPVKQYLNAGTYDVQLTATSDEGCTETISQPAVVKEVPLADFDFSNACAGEAVVFDNNSYISDGMLSYVWEFGDGAMATEHHPSHTYSVPGSYTVTLRAESSGCTDSIEQKVTTYEEPFTTVSADTSVSKGYSAQLTASGGETYFWSPIDGLSNSDVANPEATPDTTTTYTVYIEDAHGCRVARTVTIAVTDDHIIIPNNVITPDGNGVNDQWVVWNILNYPDNHVYIYNRWGQEVYQARGYQNDWEGLSGTDLLPDGTYYYVITFDHYAEKYSGALTLLRNKR